MPHVQYLQSLWTITQILYFLQIRLRFQRLAVEQKAVMLLNQLFNTDSSNEKMILVISNDSDCDFTMSITGRNSYILPVAAKHSESIVLDRGGYEVKSEVCKTPYKTFKVFLDNTNLSIKHTIVKKTEGNSARL